MADREDSTVLRRALYLMASSIDPINSCNLREEYIDRAVEEIEFEEADENGKVGA